MLSFSSSDPASTPVSSVIMRICQSTYRGIPDHPHRRSNKLFHLVMYLVPASGNVSSLPADVLIRE